MKTLHRFCARALAGIAATVLLAMPLTATTLLDPHAVYEHHCGQCHFEHGADLARLKLELRGATLSVRRSGKTVDVLLRSHHGVQVTEAESRALIELMHNGLVWGGVFQHRCAGCHKQAASFARAALVLDGGALVTRHGGRDVRQLLSGHGEASSAEIDTLIEMLSYQVRTGAASLPGKP